MAGKDKPTYNQLEVIYRTFMWRMPLSEASAAARWLEENATRKQVSAEIGRVVPLYKKHMLTKQACFASEVWRGYKGE